MTERARGAQERGVTPPGWRPGVFGASLAALVLAGVGLAYAGVRIVGESTAGGRFEALGDPAAPGFEAPVAPTPTLALLHESAGRLIAVAVLSLWGDAAGGGVMVVPGGTLVEGRPDAMRLDDVHEVGGVPFTLAAVERALAVDIGEHRVVDEATLAALVEPVAPLELVNPDEVVGFAAGPLEISSRDAPAWFEALGRGESEVTRLLRQQLLWEAWLAAIAAHGGAKALPEEADGALGRFLLGLASGDREVAALPGKESEGDDRGASWSIEPQHTAQLVGRLVPFPMGPEPGSRVRVRLLEGWAAAEAAPLAARRLVPAGAEIAIVGNAQRDDHADTEIRYREPRLAAAAQHLQEALGAGRVVPDLGPADAFEVTVVLGADAARLLGAAGPAGRGEASRPGSES